MPTASSPQLPSNDPKNTANGRHRYSILKAIRSQLPGERLDGIEAETHAELAKCRSNPPRGVLIDPGAMLEQRAATLDTTAGAGTIATVLRPDVLFIDALRPRSVVASLGARMVNLGAETGSHAKFGLPRFQTATTVGWVGESEAASSEQHATLDQALLTPATVTAYTDLSRKALRLATPEFDQFLFAEITRSIGVEVDRAALNGTGSSNQPLGLLQLLPAATALGTNGGAPTRAACIELERLVGAANADSAAGARPGFVTSPNGRAALRAVDTSTGSAGKWLWTDDDTIIGKPAYATSNIPSNITKGSGSNLTALVYGNWADLIINLFSGVDTLLNPYTQSSTGAYRLSVHQDIACQIAHEESFRVINDMATS